MHVAITGASSSIGETVAREFAEARREHHARRAAVSKRKSRLICPRFYAMARGFPRIARWLSTRVTPRLAAKP